MLKPGAIIQFERLYWASFALTIIAKGLTWSTQTAMMQANPQLAAMPWILPVMTLIGIVIAILLWFYTCRRPSVVAKWIVVVFAAIGAFGIALTLFSLAMGRLAEALPAIVALVANALYIAAAVLLFKPDARAWFGEDTVDDDMLPPAQPPERPIV